MVSPLTGTRKARCIVIEPTVQEEDRGGGQLTELSITLPLIPSSYAETYPSEPGRSGAAANKPQWRKTKVMENLKGNMRCSLNTHLENEENTAAC